MTGQRPGDYLSAGAAARRLGVSARTLPRCTHDENWERELVRDMLAIVTSFAGWLYGQRPVKARRLRAVVAAEADGRGTAA